jgi:putative tricarboxylic transport membrane protein
MRRDGIAGLVCLVTSLGLLAATIGLPGPSLLVPVGPAFYPRIILGITAVLSAALVVNDLVARRRNAAAARPARSDINYSLVLLTFSVFGVYVAILPHLGFRIATFIFVAAMQALLDQPRNARRWLLVAAVALATTVVTYYVFEAWLLVLLPRGRWTDF